MTAEWPDDAQAWNDKGLALWGLSDNERAVQCFKRAVEIEPTHRDALYNAGMYSGLRGRHDEGLVYLDTLAELASGDNMVTALREAFRERLGSGSTVEEASADRSSSRKEESMSAAAKCPHCGNELSGQALVTVDASMAMGEEMVDFSVPCSSCGRDISKRDFGGEVSASSSDKKWWQFWK